VNLNDIYLIPQNNTDLLTTFTIETAPNAKVFIGENELITKVISVNTSKPAMQTIVFRIVSGDGTKTQTHTLKVEKRFNFDDIVVSRWDNTLIVNANSTTNGDYKFTGYRWFKDNSEIGSGQYYSVGPKKSDVLVGNYYVQMTTQDGQTLRSWEKQITLKNSMLMKTYPNPLRTGEIVSVQLDVDKDLIKNTMIEIYDLNGNKVSSNRATGNVTPVVIPSLIGIYIIRAKSGEFVREEKLIVQ
jgi:hypothetical protein